MKTNEKLYLCLFLTISSRCLITDNLLKFIQSVKVGIAINFEKKSNVRQQGSFWAGTVSLNDKKKLETKR